MTKRDQPVIVSKHACQRMRERFPEVGDIERNAAAEVRAALAAGRRSKTKPVWASTYDRAKGENSTRFVWTEDQGRCYAIRPKLINGRRGILVLTVLPTGNPDTLDRMHLVRPARLAGKHSPKSLRRPRRDI